MDIKGVPMARPCDRSGTPGAGTASPRRPWLSIWFACCHVYGRIYRNAQATAYEGRCPKCGAAVGARIGPNGTNQRVFRAE